MREGVRLCFGHLTESFKRSVHVELRFLKISDKITSVKQALIVVDMQHAFGQLDVCRDSFAAALLRINSCIAKYRQLRAPVIFTRTQEADKLGIRDGWKLTSDLDVGASDFIIDKAHPNAFWQTPLEGELRKQGVSSVVVAGCFAMACVYLTHHGALERGFASAILKGGVVSSDPASIELLSRMTTP